MGGGNESFSMGGGNGEEIILLCNEKLYKLPQSAVRACIKDLLY